jgi:hypothetical protein
MGAGCREQHVQRQPVVVDEQVVLRAGFAPVSGVRAGQLAPLFARTGTASMLARDLATTRRGHAVLGDQGTSPWLFPGGQPHRPGQR